MPGDEDRDAETTAELKAIDDDYQSGVLLPRDLAEALEGVENLPAGMRSAIDQYMRDIDEDFTQHGGRGDVESYQDEFTDAYEAEFAKLSVEGADDQINLAIEEAANEAATSPQNDLKLPTKDQQEEGNYKKGRIDSKIVPWLAGMPVKIENPAKSKRKPEWPPLKNAYGYFERTEGFDNDEVDTLIGPDMGRVPELIFVVDQVDPETGKPDEHKVILGVHNSEDAKKVYLANYEKGWQGLGDIKVYEFSDFKAKLQSGFFKNSTPSRRLFKKADTAVEKAPAAPKPVKKPERLTLGIGDTWDSGIQRYKLTGFRQQPGGKPPEVSFERVATKDRKEWVPVVGKASTQWMTYGTFMKTWHHDLKTPLQETEAKPEAEPVAEAAPEEKPDYGSANTLFTNEAADAARALLKKKLGQVSAGIDPEIVQAGITLAGYHIEAGSRDFASYTKAMISDLGEAVKPYLRSWYEGVRYYPGFDNEGMTPVGQVETPEQPFDKEELPIPKPSQAEHGEHRIGQFTQLHNAGDVENGEWGEITTYTTDMYTLKMPSGTFKRTGMHLVKEAGSRDFASYTKAMISDLGEAVKPYLRSWYEGVRYYPGFDNEGMTPVGQVETPEQPFDKEELPIPKPSQAEHGEHRIGQFTQLHNAGDVENGEWGEITTYTTDMYTLKMPSGTFKRTGMHLVKEYRDAPPTTEAEPDQNLEKLLADVNEKIREQGQPVDDRLLEKKRNLEREIAKLAPIGTQTAAKPTTEPKPETLPVGQMTVEFRGNRGQVSSFEEASEKFGQLRDEIDKQVGAGASGPSGEGAKIFDANGKQIATISYNGRVWDMDNIPIPGFEQPYDSEESKARFAKKYGKKSLLGTDVEAPEPKAKGIALTDIFVQRTMNVDGKEQKTVLNASAAFTLAQERLDNLAKLKACISG